MDKFYHEVSILKFLYKNHYDDNRIDFVEIVESNGDDSYMNIISKLCFITRYEIIMKHNESKELIIETRFKDHTVIIKLKLFINPIEFFIDVYEYSKSMNYDWRSSSKYDRYEIRYEFPDESEWFQDECLYIYKCMSNHISSMNYFNEFIEYLDNSDILLNKIREYQKDYQGDSNDR